MDYSKEYAKQHSKRYRRAESSTGLSEDLLHEQREEARKKEELLLKIEEVIRGVVGQPEDLTIGEVEIITFKSKMND